MDVLPSPQPCAVGEADKNQTENQNRPSYAAAVNGNHTAVTSSKLEICPVSFQNGIPIVEFTVDEVNSFTREEGLHQAVVIKFSYGKPTMQELRQILPKLLDVKGKCNIGQLEYRHILLRFDLFEDYVNVVSRSSGYVQSKGDNFFFRTFTWTMGFNPREETPKAVVWISFSDLPANLFARKSLMTIASAVGKPLDVDKATKDRTRPSMARVKVLINLLDNHPKNVKINILDVKSGKLVEYDQQIVIDNPPAYCTYCSHQGHDEKSCRWYTKDRQGKAVQNNESEDRCSMDKAGRDAREILNEISARCRGDNFQQPKKVDAVKNNNSVANEDAADSLPGSCPDITQADQSPKELKDKEVYSRAESTKVAKQNALFCEDISVQEHAILNTDNRDLITKQNSQIMTAQTSLSVNNVADHQVMRKSAVLESISEVQKLEFAKAPIGNGSTAGLKRENARQIVNCNDQQQDSDVAAIAEKTIEGRAGCGKNIHDHINSADCEETVSKESKNTVSLKSISMADNENSIANSTFEIGSVSGRNAQQNSIQLNCGDLDSFRCPAKQLRAVQSSGTTSIDVGIQMLDKTLVAVEKETVQLDTVMDTIIQSQTPKSSRIFLNSDHYTMEKSVVTADKKEDALVMPSVNINSGKQMNDSVKLNLMSKTESSSSQERAIATDVKSLSSKNGQHHFKRVSEGHYETANDLVTGSIEESSSKKGGTAQKSKKVASVGSTLITSSEQLMSELDETEVAASDKAAYHNTNKTQLIVSEQQPQIHNKVTSYTRKHSEFPVVDTGVEAVNKTPEDVAAVHSYLNHNAQPFDSKNFLDQNQKTRKHTMRVAKQKQAANKSTAISVRSNPAAAQENLDKLGGKAAGRVIQKVRSYPPIYISSIYSVEQIFPIETVKQSTANKAGNNTASLPNNVLAKDKSPHMNNIGKEYGESSISSNKKDEESWDAILSRLNSNASIFAPRNNAKTEPRQRERSWDDRVIEDVNIRRLPMRKAKKIRLIKRPRIKYEF